MARRATSYKYASGHPPLGFHREGRGVSGATVALSVIAIPFQAATSLTMFTLFLIGLYLAFLLIALWLYQDARIGCLDALFWLAIVSLVPTCGFVGYVLSGRVRPV